MTEESNRSPLVYTHYRSESRRKISARASVTFVTLDGETIAKGTARFVDLSGRGTRMTDISLEGEAPVPSLPCRVLFRFLEGPYAGVAGCGEPVRFDMGQELNLALEIEKLSFVQHEDE